MPKGVKALIIKNGFVRDEDCNWLSLSLMSDFRVREVPSEKGVYEIYCHLHKNTSLEDHSDYWWRRTIETGFRSFQEAAEALDDGFGYEG